LTRQYCDCSIAAVQDVPLEFFMNCPVCNNAMITLELAGVEIDYSPDCGGIWLDAGELEVLSGDGQRAKNILASFKTDAAQKEKPRRCPICLETMDKAAASQSHSLLIDKCRKNHGMWFDKGELKALLSTFHSDDKNNIQKLLTEIFNLQDES